MRDLFVYDTEMGNGSRVSAVVAAPPQTSQDRRLLALGGGIVWEATEFYFQGV